MKSNDSLIAYSTLSLKKTNQDYVLGKVISKLNCKVILVADGIGSYKSSEAAAKFVCHDFINLLLEKEHFEEVNISQIYKQIHHNLKEKFFVTKQEMDNIAAYGTTLLCCMETPDEIIIGYIGNGGVFHIRGNFNSFSERVYLPWNSINLLNPHTKEYEGKNTLYRYFAPHVDLEACIPSVIRIQKDKQGAGDIIMLCSDGIFSNDEIQIGKDAKGKIWISGAETMEKFYTYLKQFINKEQHSNKSLKATLEEYLEQLKTNRLVDDDCSLAVLMTSTALNFNKRKKKEVVDEEDN